MDRLARRRIVLPRRVVISPASGMRGIASNDSFQLIMINMAANTAMLIGSTTIFCRLTVKARRTAVTSLSTIEEISAVFCRSKYERDRA
jgi:hypothetical protein